MRASNDPRRTPAYRKARRGLLAEEGSTCGLCGGYVDKTLPSHTPWSPEADHIVSIKSGGHPFDRYNLQLTHKLCNQKKAAGKKGNPLVTKQTVVYTEDNVDIDLGDDFFD